MLPRFRADRARPSLARRFGLLTVLIIAIVVALSVGRARAETLPFPDSGQERFRVTITGEGPDVLLIPGLGSSAATWDDTVTRFKDHYRLHVLNLAGFAGEPAGANASGDILPPTVEALDAYIKSHRLQHPVLVGHSAGGLLALMLAKAHPEDTGRLVLVDTLPYVGVIFDPSAAPDRIKPVADALRGGMETASQEAFKAQQAQGVSRLATAPEAQAKVLGWSLTSDRHVLTQVFYEALVTDLRPGLAAIETPAVLLYPVDTASGQTAATVEPTYKANYAGLPNLRMTPVSGSRHFIMLDQPEAFAWALADALK